MAIVDGALICAGEREQVTIRMPQADIDAPRLIELLDAGVDETSLASATGLASGDAAELLRALDERGIIGRVRPCRPPVGVPLVEAILASRGDARLPAIVWTANELLVLPPSPPRQLFRRVLRAFISGLADPVQLQAYAYAATHLARTVCGDRPTPEKVETALARLPATADGAIRVVALDGADVTELSQEEFAELGGERPHRLGPLLFVEANALPSVAAGLRHRATAGYALPNLRFADRASPRRAYGLGRSSDRAELVARAEAIERYAGGDVSGRRVVRARAAELPAVVPPTELVALSARQYRDHPEIDPYAAADEYLWAPAHTLAGDERWVAAQLAFMPFFDPERVHHLPPTSSSGLAAHTELPEARERALRELVERDAFMWTWVQAVSRERIDRHSLPPAAEELVRAAERTGWRVELVNLSLELAPVLLCAIYDDRSLHVGASCRADPGEAAAKAVEEALTMLDASTVDPAPPPAATDVERPEDHHRFYRDDPERLAAAAFLFASPDLVSLDDIAQPFGEPLEERVLAVAEPLLVDLTSKATAPFHVVRAFVPGLIPVSFGWDREPLGMPRLASPTRTAGGAELGRSINLADAAPLVPHPFA